MATHIEHADEGGGSSHTSPGSSPEKQQDIMGLAPAAVARQRESSRPPAAAPAKQPRGRSAQPSDGSVDEMFRDKAYLATRPRLGPFAIVKTIGEGSFGKVKLAVHVNTGQKVALKFISRTSVKKPDMSSRVDREIAYLKLLRHPHIIKLYHVITTPTDIIMVIEHAPRELFDHIVQNGRLDENSARRFFQQIICAVEYCHRHKIVHRDLKPENLLLDESLNVKIADFGLSNLMTDGDFLKTSCGSPNYAAPEVIGGRLYAGPEVDVWSCGVILYVMMVGRLPFDDEFIPSLFKKITSGTYTLPKWLPPGAHHLLERMLVVDPMTRITIQGIRDDPWFQENLPDYLQPYNATSDRTVDPVVVGKLGEAMGYSKDDVYAALSKSGGNVIKEAYDVVVENQAIADNTRLVTHEVGGASLLESNGLSSAGAGGANINSFLAQSPPGWSAQEIAEIKQRSPTASGSTPAEGIMSPSTVGASGPLDLSSAAGGRNKETAPKPTKIRILENSRPEAHRRLMRERENEQAGKAAEQSAAGSAGPSNSPPCPTTSALPPTVTQPASNSTKKPRPPRWHFGIRSRSPPLEVLSEIYRALHSLGAEFRVKKAVPGKSSWPTISRHASQTRPRAHSGAVAPTAASPTAEDAAKDEEPSEPSRDDDSQAGDIPDDPFFIRCRWFKYDTAKEGTPGTGTGAESGSQADSTQSKSGICVYIDIQLYSLDRDCYLVDFKCSGYEPIGIKVRNSSVVSTSSEGSMQSIQSSVKLLELARETGVNALMRMQQEQHTGQNPPTIPELQPAGFSWQGSNSPGYVKPSTLNAPLFTGKEKQVSSAFPFLDVAAMLIQNLI